MSHVSKQKAYSLQPAFADGVWPCKDNILFFPEGKALWRKMVCLKPWLFVTCHSNDYVEMLKNIHVVTSARRMTVALPL